MKPIDATKSIGVEPDAWATKTMCVGPNYGKTQYGKLPIQSIQPGYYEHEKLYSEKAVIGLMKAAYYDGYTDREEEIRKSSNSHYPPHPANNAENWNTRKGPAAKELDKLARKANAALNRSGFAGVPVEMPPAVLGHEELTMEINIRIQQLISERGGVRAAARSIGVSPSYLIRLRDGEKVAPSKNVLSKLGLRKVSMYARVEGLT